SPQPVPSASSPILGSRYPSMPGSLTAGPDGNLWFGYGNQQRIGRISPAGVITEVPIPTNGGSWGITTGPDGNLWFTEIYGNKIGRIRVPGPVPGDVEGDGKADLVWRQTQTGDVAVWLMTNVAAGKRSAVVSGGVPLAWHIVG